MKLVKLFSIIAPVALFAGCQPAAEDYSWLKNALDTSVKQLELTADEIDETGLLPRSIHKGHDIDFLERQLEMDRTLFQDSLRAQPAPEKDGQRRLCKVYDWTSGFFPGSLWYTYELTGNETIKAQAINFTQKLNPVRYYTGTHDLGFMINCSYGNALRLSPADTIKNVLIETADNLISRFNP